MVQIRKWLPLLALDAAPGKASYKKIADALAQAVRSGKLTPGTALPGTRELAALLDVNRKTVMLAYDEATAKGWLCSQPRRGTFVSDLLEPAQSAPARSTRRAPAPTSAPTQFVPSFLTPTLPRYFHPRSGFTAGGRSDAMFFDNGTADHRLLPQTVLHRYYRNAINQAVKSNAVNYGNQESATQLRTALAQMLRTTRALDVSADNLCLTQGTQMALQLAAAALIRPGDVVLVERLSYPPAWAIFQALGARIEVVDIDQHGCQVEQIDALCLAHTVRLIYVTPHHQFPTTVSMPADRRQKLLSLAVRHNFTILEEDYDHEYHFAGRPYPPLASDVTQRHVIYVGSLSKLLGSSFRCGFIAAPANLIATLNGNLSLLSSQSDAIMQKMLAKLIDDGELGKHLRRATKHYRARKDALLQQLHDAFGARIAVRSPEGGLALWVEFTGDIDVDKLVKRAAQHQLFVRSGRQFAPLDQAENALRLGFASMNPDELAQAVKRLQAAAAAR